MLGCLNCKFIEALVATATLVEFESFHTKIKSKANISANFCQLSCFVLTWDIIITSTVNQKSNPWLKTSLDLLVMVLMGFLWPWKRQKVSYYFHRLHVYRINGHPSFLEPPWVVLVPLFGPQPSHQLLRYIQLQTTCGNKKFYGAKKKKECPQAKHFILMT